MSESRSELPNAWRYFFVLALGCLGVFLQGCENIYDRTLRMSCRWNTDIVLKHCDRWTYARCIEHCEYCIAGDYSYMQLASRGQSDECAQLKCAAYCAKREDDPNCMYNYEELCLEGKRAFEDTTGHTCDVDCSSADGMKASLLLPGILALLSLQLSGMNSKTLSVGLLILVASSLQGCGTCWSGQGVSIGCVDCPPGVPSIPEFEPDLDKLDVEAGCKNEWSFIFGNPCASDVPVVMAKKGTYPSQDYGYIKEAVENEKYECLERKGKYCAKWSTYEESCHEIDYGICTCSVPSDNEEFCQEWYCVAKEAEQNVCWEACCGSDSCQPCVHCGMHGTSPFPMNSAIFEDLMAMDSVTVGAQVLGVADLAKLRAAHWGSFHYVHPMTGRGDCIVSRDVHSPYETTCHVWREIETEISFCRCLQPDLDKHYCHQWKCEEKDVGQFSILFTQARSYENNLEGQEVETYDCTKVLTSDDGTKTCGQWTGHIESWEEVETAVCKGCDDLSTPHCQSWECNEYEQKNILPHDIIWPRRLGMAVVHFLWMLPCTLFGMTICVMGCSAACGGDENKKCGIPECISTVCSAAFVVFIGTCMGFWRWKGDEGRAWVPWQPFVGALVTVLVGVCLALPILVNTGGDDAGAVVALVAAVALFFAGLTWVCGFILTGPFLLALLCCGAVMACSSSGNTYTKADNEAFYGEDEYEE